MLFHVSPGDPAAYVMAAVVLTTLAVAAALQPSRRAARVDPAITLRED
jgi:ABC-type lipoprotein release transport system permease subunit